PSFTEHLHGHLVHQQVEQHRDAPYQAHIITLIGMLQMVVQLFDSRTTALYPEAHGCLLLVGCLAYVLGEIHPCAHESQPGISNSFPEDLSIVRQKCIGLNQGRPWATSDHMSMWSKGAESRSIFSISAQGVAWAKRPGRVAQARRARRPRWKLSGASGRDTRDAVTCSQPASTCSRSASRHRHKARQARCTKRRIASVVVHW